MFGNLQKMIFGYDLSILHAGNQFTGYGEAIANYFSKSDYRCLVQQVKDLKFKSNAVTNAVNSSPLLIVLATEEATHSDFIEQAISNFTKQHKTVIAIDFGFLSDSKWYYLLKNQKKIVEKSSFVDNTDPSNAVIDLIEKTASFRAKNRTLKRSNIVSAALMLASIFVILGASYYIYHLSESLKSNMTLVEESAMKVMSETKRASEANELADEKKALADHFSRVAFANQMAAKSGNTYGSDPTRALRLAQKGFNYIDLSKDSLPSSIQAAMLNSFYGSIVNNLGFYTQEVDVISAINDFKEISQVNKYLMACNDGSIRVVNDKGNIESTFQAHDGKVNQVTYSALNQFILTTSEDSLAKLFTINGDLIHALNDHHDEITLGAISPNGTRLLTATDDTLRVWDIKGNIVGKYAVEDKIVNYAVYSPVEGLIAAAFGDEIELINFNGRIMTKLYGHEDEIVSLNFSVNGSRIMSTSFDSTAIIWAKNGQRIARLKGHNGIVNAAQFSPDRTRVITVSDDQTAKLWDWNGQFIKTMAGHTAAVVDASFSPDSKMVMTVSLDNTIKLWDNKGKLLTTFKGHKNQITKARFSHDGKYIISSSKDGTFKKWLVYLPLITAMEIHARGVKDIDYDQHDKNILTVSGRGVMRFWNAGGKLVNSNVLNGKETKQVLSTNKGQLYALVDGQAVKINATGSVEITYGQLGNENKQLAISKGQQVLAGLHDQNKVVTYDILKDSLTSRSVNGLSINSISFDNKTLLLATNKGIRTIRPDGETNVMGFGDLNIWKVVANDSIKGGVIITVNGQLIRFDGQYKVLTRYPTSYGSIAAVDIDIKNDLVFAGTKSGDLLVFKLNGEYITKIKLHKARINKVVVSKDKKQIITASEDNGAKICHSIFGINEWLKSSNLAHFAQ